MSTTFSTPTHFTSTSVWAPSALTVTFPSVSVSDSADSRELLAAPPVVGAVVGSKLPSVAAKLTSVPSGTSEPSCFFTVTLHPVRVFPSAGMPSPLRYLSGSGSQGSTTDQNWGRLTWMRRSSSKSTPVLFSFGARPRPWLPVTKLLCSAVSW